MHSVTLQSGPFGGERHVYMPLGMSIAAIAQKMHVAGAVVVAWVQSAPGSLQKWERVPVDRWKNVKPKGKNCLRLEYVPAGGGGSSNQIFAAVAAIAISVAAPYLAGTVVGAIAPVAFGMQTIGAQIATTALTAAFTVAGSLAVSKLFGGAASTPSISRPSDQAEATFGNVETDINPLARDAYPPVIHGHRRVTLPSACEPHKYLENGVDVIEACLVATGYHSATDIQIDGISIDNIPDVTYQIRDGRENAEQQTLIKHIAKTIPHGEDLGVFKFDADTDNLSDQVNPTKSDPQPVFASPGSHPKLSQITLRMEMQPFIYQSSDTAKIRLPIRITLRKKSDLATEYKLPEIHVVSRHTNPIPKEIKIRNDNLFGFIGATSDFEYDLYREVPATSDTLTDGSTGTQWEAHSMFSEGTGFQDVVNIVPSVDGINVTLDPDVLPLDDFQIEIQSGQPIRDSDFSAANYELSGTVRSLFKGRLDGGKYVRPSSRDGIFGGARLDYVVKMANQRPVEAPGFWQMPIKFRGATAKNITLKMGAYVYDYGGSDWDDLKVTQNPAPHARHILKTMLDGVGVDASLITNDQWVAFRNECGTKGYTVNHVSSGSRWIESFQSILTAGLATPSFGSGYGVAFHKNRDDETVECTFTHRDSRISFTRNFPYAPKGFVTTYASETPGEDVPVLQINNKWKKTNLASGNRSINLPQITDKTHAERITVLDALQEKYQDTTWSISTGPAGYHRQIGGLIGMVTDLNSDHAHGFFVRQVTGPRSIAVDRAILVSDTGSLDEITDLTQIADLAVAGAVSVAHILEPDGMNSYTVASVSGNIVTFTEDLPESWTVTESVEGVDTSVEYTRDQLAGTRVSIVARDSLFKKMLVLNVDRSAEENAVISAVEYRPEIAAYLEKHYP